MFKRSHIPDISILISIWLLAMFATIAISGGCSVDRSGFSFTIDDSWTSFRVRPQIVCLGETVEVNWQAKAREVGVDDCGGEDTGVICAGSRSLNAIVFLTSTPVDLFALPGNRVESSETTGTRMLMPEADTTFSLVAGYEDIGFLPPREQTVKVILPGDLAPVTRTETFTWGCTSPGGGPGWGDINYEKGDVATDRVRITKVRNISGFPIRLLVNRPDAIPPVVVFEFYGDFVETDLFNGEYYGLWAAAPLAPGIFTFPDCSATGPASGPLDAVPGMPPISPPASVPNIVVEVTVSCATGGI